MDAVIAIDFGSTNTKVVAICASEPVILGTAAASTTPQTDIGDGLAVAMDALVQKTGALNVTTRLACSSAAGGLGMFACGLVPELTAKAASLAALGAGARLKKVFSYELTDEDIRQIDQDGCDIFLLTGGTDGGNKDCAMHNAKMLAACNADFPVIIACNRTVAHDAARILSDRECHVCDNVMPAINQLRVEAVREKIREIFLRKIVHAKGLSREAELISGIMMPTPAAFLAAIALLAKGTADVPGLGDIFALDIGGATTDCYSCADGAPSAENMVQKGLPEPWAKRTVEGDIGMRISAGGVICAAGIEQICAISGADAPTVDEYIRRCEKNPATMPTGSEEENIDFALAAMAAQTASMRHAGHIEQVYTPIGQTWVLSGKDLSKVDTMVASGGALAHMPRAHQVAAYALAGAQFAHSMRPAAANILVDTQYIVSAMGLLAGHNPLQALQIMRENFMSAPHTTGGAR